MEDTSKPAPMSGQVRPKSETAAAPSEANSTSGGLVHMVKEKVTDVAAGASELVVKAKDTAHELASSVGDAAAQVKHKARELTTEAAHNAEDLGRDATALIRRYPVATLLVAFGVGFVAAQAIRRA
jgi:ElaB/YqjD/DUF883 family membrane-anchored ribosome-binding protein